jgi:heme/copper-type cytochrome/quinol oxidase subunit 4
MHRFRSPMISLALSVILTLLAVAAALASGQPPNPR